MVFPTLQFVLFFAIVLTLNVLVSRRAGARKALLIAVSYVFYAAWDWRFCLLMLGVSCVAWIAGLFVKDARWGQVTKVGAIVLMLGVLGVFKYFNFFLLSFQQLLGDTMFARDLGWMRVVLPIGISFYTFQAISYV
ncbi:MBOAT family protein, partial [Octadecabacter sp.]|nr:MBOAT family protein [Octadecabacter sp.]